MMKQRCPICLFMQYDEYPRGYDPPEPAETFCNVCHLSWMEGMNHHEVDAINDHAQAVVDDVRGYLREWLKNIWLQPWLLLRCWIIVRREKP